MCFTKATYVRSDIFFDELLKNEILICTPTSWPRAEPHFSNVVHLCLSYPFSQNSAKHPFRNTELINPPVVSAFALVHFTFVQQNSNRIWKANLGCYFLLEEESKDMCSVYV